MKVTVIGCGVIGLSTGIRLLEAGHRVSLWGRELPLATTSSIAAAIWYPYQAFPEERVLGWGRRTFAVLEALARVEGSGVTLASGLELLREEVSEPRWTQDVRGFRHAAPEQLPPGYRDGYAFQVPVIEMPVYLPYLARRIEQLGGSIVQREVRSLAEALEVSDRVVHCTGLGARELVGDRELFPIRGQLVRTARGEVSDFFIDDGDPQGPAYVIPRSRDCIVGGTAEVGATSLELDPEIARQILDRAARLCPAVRRAAVLGHHVGLRPGRREVRLEAQGRVIHCYGHGGAGVTLSWGCAEEVVALCSEQPEAEPRGE